MVDSRAASIKRYYDRLKAERKSDPANEVRTCTGCGELKFILEFGARKTGRGGYDNKCKRCRTADATDTDEKRRRREVYYEARKQSWQALPPDTARTCSKCGETKRITAFRKMPMGKDGYSAACNQCCNELAKIPYRRYRNKHWARAMVKNTSVRLRAKASDGALVTEAQLLEKWEQQEGRCHWFGVSMLTASRFYGDPRKVSVDRVDRSRGYTAENTVLTCFAANMGRNRCPEDEWAIFVNELKSHFVASR